jgi:gamma-glutamylputrescine oxidase
MISHVSSYYAATQLDDDLFFNPTLMDRVEVDVCIIGGGLAGLTTALECAKSGKSVVLLEANRIGWGASGRNAGFVNSGFAKSIFELEAEFGIDHAKALFRLSRDGVSYVKNQIGNIQAHDLIEGKEALEVVRYGNGEGLQKAAERLALDYGFSQDYLNKDQLQALLKTQQYKAGLLDHEGIHIHPLHYTLSLAKMAQSKTVQIYENSRVEHIEKSGNRWCAHISLPNTGQLSKGRSKVEANHMVLACSAYGGPYKPIERAILPIATYIIASKPMPDQIDEAINFTGTIADDRRAGDYYRISGKGDERRLIWGGRITTKRKEPKALAAMLKQDITAIYPQFSNMEIDYAWSGFMGYARHKMPIIRQMEDNLWVATAFGGHGLNTTAMAGQLIASAITDNNDQYRLFEPFTAKWCVGKIGQLAIQMEYWRMQALDSLEEYFSK